jgi:hypothetical protein
MVLRGPDAALNRLYLSRVARMNRQILSFNLKAPGCQ